MLVIKVRQYLIGLIRTVTIRIYMVIYTSEGTIPCLSLIGKFLFVFWIVSYQHCIFQMCAMPFTKWPLLKYLVFKMRVLGVLLLTNNYKRSSNAILFVSNSLWFLWTFVVFQFFMRWTPSYCYRFQSSFKL